MTLRVIIDHYRRAPRDFWETVQGIISIDRMKLQGYHRRFGINTILPTH
jgi:hypothetical protein